jgi:uncharacterized protein (DUF2336 family)
LRSGAVVTKSFAYPNLEGLDRLALRRGVDIRPTLVRVLTDLYLQKSAHTAEEERHYTELVLRLIDRVDIATRKIVAAKLAHYAPAPAAVVRQLARDVLEVAEPILEHSHQLKGSDLLAIITELGLPYAAVIARRLRIAAHGQDAQHRASADIDLGTAKDTGPAAARGPDEPAKPPPLLHSRNFSDAAARASLDTDLRIGDMFLAAGPKERRLILSQLADANCPLSASPPPPSNAIAALESAALQRKPAEFTRALERALGIAAEHAQRIVMDDSGEPLLIAAKSLGMAADTLLRVLLFLNPVIGQSVTRVFDLAKLYDTIPRETALRLIASLRSSGATRRWASYRPVLATAEPQRGLAGESARRAVGRGAARPQGPRADPLRDDIDQM